MNKLVSSCAFAIVASSLLACGGADSTNGACGSESYPDAPAGSTNVVHVSAACPASGADGSVDRPYATITSAVLAAGKGATVLIAAGTYAENLALVDDVALIGPSTKGSRGAGAGVVLQAPSGDAIRVSAGAKVSVDGFDVQNPKSVGVLAIGGSATVTASKIEGATEDATQPGVAYGVSAATDGAIILQDSAVVSSGDIGVYIVSASGTIDDCDITENTGAGVRLDGSHDVTISNSTIESNGGMGIGVFSSGAIILQNQIKSTRLATIPNTQDQIGDGLVVGSTTGAGNSAITAKTNVITGSGRAGILAAAGAHGIILQDNTVNASADKAGFGAGIWLQDGAGTDGASSVKHNTLTGNKFVGIGMTGDTHGIILQNNTVTGTTSGTFFTGGTAGTIGDGMNVLAGASGSITTNTVTGNARLGIILDKAAGSLTFLGGNTVSDNSEGGIILQDQAADEPMVAADTMTTIAAPGHFSLNSAAFASAP